MKQRLGFALSLILLTTLTLTQASRITTAGKGAYTATLPLDEAANYDVNTVDCSDSHNLRHVNGSFFLWKELMQTQN
jgi:hypothetical protein